uniref:C2H2-type domain-containing protein n=1 Tax=Chromera velia CCMP2878 TaxID=1169474 RepID=A0A0G4HDR3_9ALVE
MEMLRELPAERKFFEAAAAAEDAHQGIRGNENDDDDFSDESVRYRARREERRKTTGRGAGLPSSRRGGRRSVSSSSASARSERRPGGKLGGKRGGVMKSKAKVRKTTKGAEEDTERGDRSSAEEALTLSLHPGFREEERERKGETSDSMSSSADRDGSAVKSKRRKKGEHRVGGRGEGQPDHKGPRTGKGNRFSSAFSSGGMGMPVVRQSASLLGQRQKHIFSQAVLTTYGYLHATMMRLKIFHRFFLEMMTEKQAQRQRQESRGRALGLGLGGFGLGLPSSSHSAAVPASGSVSASAPGGRVGAGTGREVQEGWSGDFERSGKGGGISVEGPTFTPAELLEEMSVTTYLAVIGCGVEIPWLRAYSASSRPPRVKETLPEEKLCLLGGFERTSRVSRQGGERSVPVRRVWTLCRQLAEAGCLEAVIQVEGEGGDRARDEVRSEKGTETGALAFAAGSSRECFFEGSETEKETAGGEERDAGEREGAFKPTGGISASIPAARVVSTETRNVSFRLVETLEVRDLLREDEDEAARSFDVRTEFEQFWRTLESSCRRWMRRYGSLTAELVRKLRVKRREENARRLKAERERESSFLEVRPGQGGKDRRTEGTRDARRETSLDELDRLHACEAEGEGDGEEGLDEEQEREGEGEEASVGEEEEGGDALGVGVSVVKAEEGEAGGVTHMQQKELKGRDGKGKGKKRRRRTTAKLPDPSLENLPSSMRLLEALNSRSWIVQIELTPAQLAALTRLVERLSADFASEREKGTVRAPLTFQDPRVVSFASQWGLPVDAVLKHLSTSRRVAVERVKAPRFRCPFCASPFFFLHHLKKHVERDHQGVGGLPSDELSYMLPEYRETRLERKRVMRRRADFREAKRAGLKVARPRPLKILPVERRETLLLGTVAERLLGAAQAATARREAAGQQDEFLRGLPPPVSKKELVFTSAQPHSRKRKICAPAGAGEGRGEVGQASSVLMGSSSRQLSASASYQTFKGRTRERGVESEIFSGWGAVPRSDSGESDAVAGPSSSSSAFVRGPKSNNSAQGGLLSRAELPEPSHPVWRLMASLHKQDRESEFRGEGGEREQGEEAVWRELFRMSVTEVNSSSRLSAQVLSVLPGETLRAFWEDRAESLALGVQSYASEHLERALSDGLMNLPFEHPKIRMLRSGLRLSLFSPGTHWRQAWHSWLCRGLREEEVEAIMMDLEKRRLVQKRPALAKARRHSLASLHQWLEARGAAGRPRYVLTKSARAALFGRPRDLAFLAAVGAAVDRSREGVQPEEVEHGGGGAEPRDGGGGGTVKVNLVEAKDDPGVGVGSCSGGDAVLFVERSFGASSLAGWPWSVSSLWAEGVQGAGEGAEEQSPTGSVVARSRPTSLSFRRYDTGASGEVAVDAYRHRGDLSAPASESASLGFGEREVERGTLHGRSVIPDGVRGGTREALPSILEERGRDARQPVTNVQPRDDSVAAAAASSLSRLLHGEQEEEEDKTPGVGDRRDVQSWGTMGGRKREREVAERERLGDRDKGQQEGAGVESEFPVESDRDEHRKGKRLRLSREEDGESDNAAGGEERDELAPEMMSNPPTPMHGGVGGGSDSGDSVLSEGGRGEESEEGLGLSSGRLGGRRDSIGEGDGEGEMYMRMVGAGIGTHLSFPAVRAAVSRMVAVSVDQSNPLFKPEGFSSSSSSSAPLQQPAPVPSTSPTSCEQTRGRQQMSAADDPELTNRETGCAEGSSFGFPLCRPWALSGDPAGVHLGGREEGGEGGDIASASFGGNVFSFLECCGSLNENEPPDPFWFPALSDPDFLCIRAGVVFAVFGDACEEEFYLEGPCGSGAPPEAGGGEGGGGGGWGGGGGLSQSQMSSGSDSAGVATGLSFLQEVARVVPSDVPKVTVLHRPCVPSVLGDFRVPERGVKGGGNEGSFGVGGAFDLSIPSTENEAGSRERCVPGHVLLPPFLQHRELAGQAEVKDLIFAATASVGSDEKAKEKGRVSLGLGVESSSADAGISKYEWSCFRLVCAQSVAELFSLAARTLGGRMETVGVSWLLAAARALSRESAGVGGGAGKGKAGGPFVEAVARGVCLVLGFVRGGGEVGVDLPALISFLAGKFPSLWDGKESDDEKERTTERSHFSDEKGKGTKKKRQVAETETHKAQHSLRPPIDLLVSVCERLRLVFRVPAGDEWRLVAADAENSTEFLLTTRVLVGDIFLDLRLEGIPPESVPVLVGGVAGGTGAGGVDHHASSFASASASCTAGEGARVSVGERQGGTGAMAAGGIDRRQEEEWDRERERPQEHDSLLRFPFGDLERGRLRRVSDLRLSSYASGTLGEEGVAEPERQAHQAGQAETEKKGKDRSSPTPLNSSEPPTRPFHVPPCIWNLWGPPPPPNLLPSRHSKSRRVLLE